MLAYHSNPQIKTDVLAQLEAHRKADQLVQGYGYWKDGKGCAVGCTLHNPNGGHSQYETQFGIPRTLALLEDNIFEGLPVEQARLWPARFMSSIAVGADLSGVWPQFAVWMLTDEKDGVLQYAENDDQRDMIREVAAALARGETDQQKLHDMRERAWRVRTSAFSAAYAAARAAYAAANAADAAYAAADAANAAYAAADAAYAAADAANAAAAARAADAANAAAAARAADAANAADAAYAAAAASRRQRRAGGSGGGVGASSPAAASAALARRSHREAQAEKLIALLVAAPVPAPALAA